MSHKQSVFFFPVGETGKSELQRKIALLREIPHDENDSIKGAGMVKWSIKVEL